MSSSLPIDRMRFFFSDERGVPAVHEESNYCQAMRLFLGRVTPALGSVARMEAERSDRDAAARDYESLLPDKIDILLLGVGVDGHIASLFPFSSALQFTRRTVLAVTGPNPPKERLTVTPNLITSASNLYLLATGEEKGKVLATARMAPEDYISLPVRLALTGNWLLDTAALERYNRLL